MSINSALVKLADKIDVDGKSTISPEYKNPNNSIEKSIERIADNYNGSGGGGATGGGGLIVTIIEGDEVATLSETWKTIWDAYKTGERVIALSVYEEEGNIDAMQYSITEVYVDNGDYIVDTGGRPFSTSSENGYPSSVK